VKSKWRRLFDGLGGRIALNRRNKRPRRSPSTISEQDEDDGTLSISADDKLALESASPTEPQLVSQVIDADCDWEARKIAGKEDVDGVLHYVVDWYPTIMPGHSLGHAKEKVDKYEARIRVQRKVKNGRGN
jgi:hypothetical protein